METNYNLLRVNPCPSVVNLFSALPARHRSRSGEAGGSAFSAVKRISCLRLINLSTMINQLKGKTLCDNRKVLIEGHE